jgi:hypothetical protein
MPAVPPRWTGSTGRSPRMATRAAPALCGVAQPSALRVPSGYSTTFHPSSSILTARAMAFRLVRVRSMGTAAKAKDDVIAFQRLSKK